MVSSKRSSRAACYSVFHPYRAEIILSFRDRDGSFFQSGIGPRRDRSHPTGSATDATFSFTIHRMIITDLPSDRCFPEGKDVGILKIDYLRKVLGSLCRRNVRTRLRGYLHALMPQSHRQGPHSGDHGDLLVPGITMNQAIVSRSLAGNRSQT